MKYIVFYDTKANGELGEMLGSEGIFAPDQRYSILTLVCKVENKEYSIPDRAKAFSINEGFSISNNHNVSGLIEIKK